MDVFLEIYWPVILVGLVIGVIAAFLIFRPKQSVRLSDEASPRRPHMDGHEEHEGRSVVDAAAAGMADALEQPLQTEVHDFLPGAKGPGDDLKQLKGVGPRLEDTLNANGISRFDQLAALDAAQLEKLDAHLGSFQGRLQRDRVVEQAAFLARGDTDGYEARFGKL